MSHTRNLSIFVLGCLSAFGQSPTLGLARPLVLAGDLGQQIDQSFSLCAGGCTVNLPPGTYRFSTPIVMNRPGLQLHGAGGQATHLIFEGTSGAAIDMRMNPFTIDTHDAIQGFSIELENDNTTAVLTGDITSATYRDLLITCDGRQNTRGISIYLLNGWFERNLFDSVDVKYCSYDLIMEVDPSDQANSLGYNKFLQVGLNVGDNETGVLIGSRAMLYHSILNLSVNMDTSANNRFMWIAGTSHANSYQIVGEAVSPTAGIVVASGGNWEDGSLSRGGLVYLDNMTNYAIPK
jgi:hypothetical protein